MLKHQNPKLNSFWFGVYLTVLFLVCFCIKEKGEKEREKGEKRKPTK